MANQDAFTAEEWTLLRIAPSLVSGGVVTADPSGLLSSIKESFAGARGVTEAFKASSALDLFSALAADHSLPATPDPKMLLGTGSREQQMQDLKKAVLERVTAAVALVPGKGSSEETEAYKRMLVSVAEQAASASKEGGFLGFGGVRVSDKEKSFIAEVKAAAGIS